MSFEDVMKHYGFEADSTHLEEANVMEYRHPHAKDRRDMACTVLVFGNRALVHCQYGSPIYSVSPHDTEHLLRREFECFSGVPAVKAA